MRSYKFLTAAAALLALSSAAVAAPASRLSSSFSWSGFHVGANAGFVSEDSTARAENLYFNGALETAGFRVKDDAGFTGGGQIGYAVEMGEVVLGIEADINHFGAQRSYVGSDVSVKVEGDYLGTIRPTVGFAVGEGLLAYATGGFAYGKTSAKSTEGGLGDAFSDSIVRTGWALGGGMKYAVTDNIIAGGEYLYVNLGSETYNQTSRDPLRLHDESISHVLRAKVDWKFN